jgi:hypothetical protein
MACNSGQARAHRGNGSKTPARSIVNPARSTLTA